MFTLNDYADVLLELLRKERDEKKRNETINAWLEMLKRHHRIAEGEKILDILKDRLEQLSDKAQITVSTEAEKHCFQKIFQAKKIKVDWEIDSSLMGGARIIWNNLLIDNTVNRQLDRLRNKLAGKK